MRMFVGLLLVCAGAVAACAAATPPPQPAGHYRDPSTWLCLPSRLTDPCHHDLVTTKISPDGSTSVEAAAAAGAPADRPADCFYVYPTVDLSPRADNHSDFTDVSQIVQATRSQVARFGQVCSLYVPLYRQATIGSYLSGANVRDEKLNLAYADIADAFRYYLAAYNHGRDIILIGHSQGAEMITRLLVEFFDRDPGLRARLVIALPIGGHLEVPVGRTVGGTFRHLPACTALGETGCILGYRSYRDGNSAAADQPAPAPGNESLCVNPGDLAAATASAPIDATYLRSDRLEGMDGITTPFVSFPALYQARCVPAGSAGTRVLAITEVPGARRSPMSLDRPRYAGRLGTHVLDFQIAQDSLIGIVRRAEQARAGRAANK
jgi:hypothetical protein